MEHETPVGSLLHLALFVSGAAVIGIVALAVLQRLVDGDGRRGVRLFHIAITAGVFVAFVGAEVLYHLFGEG